MRIGFFAMGLVLLVGMCAKGAERTGERTVVEVSKPLPPTQGLGARGEEITAAEKPFRGKVTEKPINHWAGIEVPPAVGQKEDPKEKEARKKEDAAEQAAGKGYTLAGQAG